MRRMLLVLAGILLAVYPVKAQTSVPGSYGDQNNLSYDFVAAIAASENPLDPNILANCTVGSPLCLDAVQGYPIADFRTPELYGASGSLATTTCSTTAGNPTISCASATSWAKDQGIRLNARGAAYSGSAPSALSVSQVGTPGVESVSYWVRPIDANGGVGPAVAAPPTATSNATLSYTNYNLINWNASPSGVVGYAIYKGTPTGTLIGVTKNLSFRDFGVIQSNLSDWLPSNTTPGETPGFHVAKITGISGLDFTLDVAPLQTGASALASHDDTQAIKDMLATCVSAQCRFVASKTYPISSKIIYNVVGKLVGDGSSPSKYSAIQTSLRWNGPPGEMFALGGDDGLTLISGGKIEGLLFDGRGMASTGFAIRDASNCGLNGVTIRGTLENGLLITNSSGLLSYACSFYDLYVPLQDSIMTEAHAVTFDGYWDGTGVSSNSGITNMFFNHPIVNHLAGHGFYWPGGVGHGGGDGIHLAYPQAFRIAGASGYSFSMETTDASRVTGDLVVTGPAQLRSGINIVQPGRLEGSMIFGLDLVNVQSFALAATPIFGAGAGDLSAISVDGTYFGALRYPCGSALACFNDPMNFIAIGGGVVTTANGSWLNQQTLGASISAGSLGLTGVNLSTGAAIGSRAAMYYPLNQNGFKVTQQPQLLFSAYLTTQPKVTIHWGFFADTLSTTTDYIGITYDPDLNTNFLCETRAGGVPTTQDSGRSPAINTVYRWRVEASPARVVVYYAAGSVGIAGTGNPALWHPVCTITTNIPTAFLRAGVSITANEAVVKETNLLHWSLVNFMGGW